MTEVIESHLYTSHASSGAAYLTAIEALLDQIASSTAWVRSYSATKISGNAVLAILTHPSGAQIAFWLYVLGNAFTSPYDNHIRGTAGTDDRWYMAYKPSNVPTTFSTINNPKDDNDYVALAGSTKFQRLTTLTDVNLANRRFVVVMDDTDPWMMIEYQETTGTPGVTSTYTVVSDAAGSLLVPSSVYPLNAYASNFLLNWNTLGDYFPDALDFAQAFDYTGQLLTIRSGSLVDGVLAVDMSFNANAYNSTQPWYISEGVLAVKGETIGKLDVTRIGWANPSGPTAKTKINGGDYQCYGSLCAYWENAWTVD